MSLTSQSLKNPAAIAVLVAILLLLGGLTLLRLPMQLFPDIERPQITVNGSWRAASPSEIESEIAEPLEDVLQGIPGTTSMRSWSNAGNVWINLEFSLGTDMNETLIEVISRLNRLPPLPADADPPRVLPGGWGGDLGNTLIWLFAQRLPDSPVSANRYVSYLRENIIPKLEAVEGVSAVELQAGGDNDRQLQITFDPVRAAQLGVELTDLAAAVGRATDVSGGFVDVGRRQYTLRFRGRYDPDDLSDLILNWRNGSPVHLGDVATVSLGPSPQTQVVYQNGNPAVGMQVTRENDANVLATIDRLTAVLDELNAGELARQGINIQKSFDPSVFINRAINLLTSNLAIGIALAIGALWWFLRRGRATLMIATTIPICLMTTFIILDLAGRSLNVISLAGLAFATGMVLDAAIVVLENIVRLRDSGKTSDSAAEIGTRQVWGALLASTVTTVAIFLPIIFLEDIEGQLFADLALTIAIAVGVSLIVAVTVLPAAAKTWLRSAPAADGRQGWWNAIADRIMTATDGHTKRITWVAGLIGVPLAATYFLMPSLNYLPPVKRDAVDAFISFPSGATVDVIEREVVQVIVERLRPYMEGEREPALRNYYFISWPGGGSLGVRVADQSRVKEMEAIVNNEILTGFPDVVAFAQQGNLFGGFGGNGGIELSLQSADYDALGPAALTAKDLIAEVLPGARVQLNPDPQVVSPELHLIPDDQRIAEVGYSRDDVARIMRALGDGLWLGEHFDGTERLDIIMRADQWNEPELLESVPVATPQGGIVPLGELVSIERDVGPNRIQRLDGRRSVSININPPDGMALQDALTVIKSDIEPALVAALPADGTIIYGGSADSLNRAITTLGTNFLLALGLLFLIMAALFKSLKDAGLVLISIPLATVGGVVALTLLNLVAFQPMDLLTMIGFIILLGLVVNNAILLVVQTRSSEEEGLSRRDAVHTALRLRIRPILMSTTTSLAGMLPLLIFPGAGSAIYRGMAAAIVGGMSVSTLFTLILLPSLLQFGRARISQLAVPPATATYIPPQAAE